MDVSGGAATAGTPAYKCSVLLPKTAQCNNMHAEELCDYVSMISIWIFKKNVMLMSVDISVNSLHYSETISTSTVLYSCCGSQGENRPDAKTILVDGHRAQPNS